MKNQQRLIVRWLERVLESKTLWKVLHFVKKLAVFLTFCLTSPIILILIVVSAFHAIFFEEDTTNSYD